MPHHRISLLAALLALFPPVSLSADDVTVQLPAGDGFVIQDNTGTIERYRIDEATGNVSRDGSRFLHSTGSPGNIYLGLNAGNLSGFGGANTGVGYLVLSSVTTGDSNTGMGWGALRFASGGSQNSAFGIGALGQSTTASLNSAFGKDALGFNLTGSANAAFGNAALRSNTSSRNSAFGTYALRVNTSGPQNSAFGYNTLRSNTTGSANSAFGVGALRASTASGNSAFGWHALYLNEATGFNSAFGYEALYTNTAGAYNNAFGFAALRSNVNGEDNNAFGRDALFSNTTGDSNVAIGERALLNATSGDSNVAIGTAAGVNQTTGSNNIYLSNNGVAGESNQIRIGTQGTQTDTFIGGISGNAVASGEPVFVTSTGELGTQALVTEISIGPSSSTSQACSTAAPHNFCALSRVQMVSMLNSGTNNWCSVSEAGGQWQVCARGNGTTEMLCSMRCF